MRDPFSLDDTMMAMFKYQDDYYIWQMASFEFLSKAISFQFWIPGSGDNEDDSFEHCHEGLMVIYKNFSNAFCLLAPTGALYVKIFR